jgi:hypothetical protein
MNSYTIPGSGNSLVGPRDDGQNTYTDYQRCKHCLTPMSYKDALDDVHDDCLGNERLGWNCNTEGCEHSWECAGIPMQCPVCGGFNIDSAVTERLDNVRGRKVADFIQKTKQAA